MRARGLLLCSFGLLACGAPPSGNQDDEADGTDEADSESGGDSDTTSEGESETTGPTEPPWGDPVDPCEDVTCSGHGTCIATGALASCECEDGYLASRHECIACTPLGDDHVYDVDVPMIIIQPEVTIAGAPPPLDDEGAIYLVATSNSWARIVLPDVPAAMAVIPGVYDLDFARTHEYEDGDSLPPQTQATFATNRTIDASGDLLIDVPVVTVTGAVRINDEPEPSSNWALSVVDPVESYHSTDLEQVAEHTAALEVIPGVWDVVFRDSATSGTIVANDAVIAKSGHMVFDIAEIAQYGALTVGGQPFADLPADGGEMSVSLLSPQLGQLAIAYPMIHSDYEGWLIPGTYDVLYEYDGWYDTPGLPDNERAILPAGLMLSMDGATTDIDIPIVTRSGALTLNGVPVAANEWGSELYYVNRATNDRVLIHDLAWGEYAIEMIPGVYDLLYHVYEYRPGLPANQEALISTGIVVDESGSFDIDVPMITLSGAITVNGQVAGQQWDAEIHFRQPEIDAGVRIPDISTGVYGPTNMIPGIYDIVYAADDEPLGLPTNTWAPVLSGVTLTESGSFDIDVPAIEVTGTITINGEPVPDGVIELYQVGGEEALLGSTDGPYSTLVVPGTYAVEYSRDSTSVSDTRPNNTRAILDCIVIE